MQIEEGARRFEIRAGGGARKAIEADCGTPYRRSRRVGRDRDGSQSLSSRPEDSINADMNR